MTSPVPLVIALLKASSVIGAKVGDRIEPELATRDVLPRIVVRQASSRELYGLARSANAREARVTVLCAAERYTAADALAEAVRDALKDVRHAKVGQHRVTVMQDGEDVSSADPNRQNFTRITGYRVSISG